MLQPEVLPLQKELVLVVGSLRLIRDFGQLLDSARRIRHLAEVGFPRLTLPDEAVHVLAAVLVNGLDDA